MIVSVVNNTVSDDCNSTPLERNEVYLRVTFLNPAIAFHYSLDAVTWRMVRYFTLHSAADLRVGFSSQSPTGTGCRVRFQDIRYTPVAVQDIRNGA